MCVIKKPAVLLFTVETVLQIKRIATHYQITLITQH